MAHTHNFGNFDLIVVGGGTAGSAAAITAGRLGLSCLVIEPLSFLGGTSTGGLVTPMMGNHLETGPLNLGLTAELVQDMANSGEAKGYALNPERLKLFLEQKALDAGVTLLYESSVIDIDSLSPDCLKVSIASRCGLGKAQAKSIIDATGDAYVARLAGAEVLQGREQTGEHQPMSLRFVLGDVNIPEFKDFFHPEKNNRLLMKQQAERDGWPEDWIKTFGMQFFETPGRPGELWFNCPRLSGFDPLDPLSRSKAYSLGRKMIHAYVKLFRKYASGAENAFLAMVAPMIGIREGQRIVGEYILTADDFHNARKFDDGICANRYPIDIHRNDKSGVELIQMPAGQWHEIPYRCLIPKGVRGLIVAGRCISSDFVSQSSYRIIPNCHTLGQAAGIAAALAKEQGCDISEVCGKTVKEKMSKINNNG
jgi:FAD dependent oxidoreductase